MIRILKPSFIIVCCYTSQAGASFARRLLEQRSGGLCVCGDEALRRELALHHVGHLLERPEGRAEERQQLHRAHAVSALEARGYKKVDLDDFDVWGYELSQRA